MPARIRHEGIAMNGWVWIAGSITLVTVVMLGCVFLYRAIMPY